MPEYPAIHPIRALRSVAPQRPATDHRIPTSRLPDRFSAFLLLFGFSRFLKLPPVKALPGTAATVGTGELCVRQNRWPGTTTATGEGIVVVLPGVHALRRCPLQGRMYRLERSAKTDGEAPFQSIEGRQGTAGV